MKKLILFIHGLGGNRETWGNFPELIEKDEAFTSFDVAIYKYPTTYYALKIWSLSSRKFSLF